MEYNKFQCECKKYRMWKKDFRSNASRDTCENSRYLKSFIIESVIVCDKIINITDHVSTNLINTLPTFVTNTISTNVTSTVLLNSDNENVICKTDCYILRRFLLVSIFLFIVATICYYYAKHNKKIFLIVW